MFESDLLSELNFVLEFNLPKEISDNQDCIKLSVSHVIVPVVEIPACPIGCKSKPIRTHGEIHCIEYHKFVKDALPFIDKWVDNVYHTCGKFSSVKSNQFVEAKLYSYKKDGSLFKKWRLIDLYPLLNPNNEYPYDVIKLIFAFETIIGEVN